MIAAPGRDESWLQCRFERAELLESCPRAALQIRFCADVDLR
jgi:hypothetical protein